MTLYERLLELYKKESILRSIRSVLTWDIQTGKMPAKGIAHRSKQFQYLTQKSQEFWKSAELENLMSSLRPDQFDDQVKRRNIELITRSFNTKTKLPDDLLPKLSAQVNRTDQSWKKAKKAVDFSIVKSDLQDLFELNWEYAHKLSEIKGMDDPFDALIDERDQGLDSDNIERYFSEARKFLVPFIKKQTKRFEGLDPVETKIKLSRREEERLTSEIAELFHYPISGENARGSIDEVEHPLTISCGPDDIRITIKYGRLMRVIHATNHELGHALHGLKKNQNWRYQPLNDFGSPSVGEMTSRYTENKIGKEYEFYIYLLPLLNELSSNKLQNVSVDRFYDCVRKVKPGPSRMEADEVTYGIHIIIRFELEKMLFSDQLNIDELPQAWNDKYEEYLGVEIPNDTVGVMQDLHYYNQYYGYFHGYFMGDLMGSQMHYFMEQELSEWRSNLATGDLSRILSWHVNNIYSKGALYPPLDLVVNVTGQHLDVKYFKEYLGQKYQE